MSDLLTREEFNAVCLRRDGYACRVCGAEQDLSVHHIIERKLWSDGGYYKENGITVCPKCHIQVEGGFILPQNLWVMIGVRISEAPLPNGFDTEDLYDKWGNKILWFDEEQESYIVIPVQGNEKFEKAVRLAGGIVRYVNGQWLQEYMGIDGLDKDERACYIARLKPLHVKRNEGEY